MTREHAFKLRQMIEKASVSLPDEDALEAVELFPAWKPGEDYERGDRRQRNGKLYRCEQSHTSQEIYPPEIVPALWTEVALPGEIPVWRQPTGAQDAYNTGDRVHYPGADDPVYESLIDANVYSPEAYPQGWEMIE